MNPRATHCSESVMVIYVHGPLGACGGDATTDSQDSPTRRELILPILLHTAYRYLQRNLSSSPRTLLRSCPATHDTQPHPSEATRTPPLCNIRPPHQSPERGPAKQTRRDTKRQSWHPNPPRKTSPPHRPQTEKKVSRRSSKKSWMNTRDY